MAYSGFPAALPEWWLHGGAPSRRSGEFLFGPMAGRGWYSPSFVLCGGDQDGIRQRQVHLSGSSDTCRFPMANGSAFSQSP